MLLFQWFSRHAGILPGLFLYLMALPLAHAEEIVQDLRYTYDAAGNILQIEQGLSQSPQIPWVVNYEYDDLNRLLNAESVDFPGSDYTRSYTYDSIGNMTSSSTVGAMTYGGNGFPSPHAVTTAGGKNYSYDANGNMVSDGVHEYAWTIRDELERTERFDFSYDASGQRVKSIDNETGEETIYVNRMMEIRNGKPIYFVYAGNERVAQMVDGKIQYLHPDHLGGVSMVTDEKGKVVEHFEYDPYGEILVHDKEGGSSSAPSDEQVATADVGSPYSFTGKEYDEDLGLYYFEARYYNPELGRFVGMDPLQHDDFSRFLDDPQAFNGYSYARNNPMVYVDPSGEFFYEIFKSDQRRTLSTALIFWGAYTGNYYTSKFLSHSLQDNPQNMEFLASSNLSNAIMGTQEYQNKIEQIREQISQGTFSGSFDDFYINSDEDLSLSVHGGFVTWDAKYNQGNGSYDLSILVDDDYDFKLENYGNAVKIINDVAFIEQEIGIIQPYNIKIHISDNTKLD